MVAAWPADAHMFCDAVDRLRIADDQRVADFAFGPDIFHKTLRRPRHRRSGTSARSTPSAERRFRWPAGACGWRPFPHRNRLVRRRAHEPRRRRKARDYSETLFLPKTDFPMRAGLPQKEPEILARWQKLDLYGRLRAAGQGPAAIRAPRRAALRQRQHPYRPRAQQDPQGRGDAQPADARLRFQLRAGLGLPRPADRMEDRGGELPRQGQAEAGFLQSRGAGRIPPRVPRLRRSTGSTCSARNSSGSASSATGRIPTPRWIFPPRRRSRAS